MAALVFICCNLLSLESSRRCEHLWALRMFLLPSKTWISALMWKYANHLTVSSWFLLLTDRSSSQKQFGFPRSESATYVRTACAACEKHSYLRLLRISFAWNIMSVSCESLISKSQFSRARLLRILSHFLAAECAVAFFSYYFSFLSSGWSPNYAFPHSSSHLRSALTSFQFCLPKELLGNAGAAHSCRGVSFARCRCGAESSPRVSSCTSCYLSAVCYVGLYPAVLFAMFLNW